MDTDHPEALNDLERRLSGWRPNAEGLDPDAVLFAAGRASVQSGKTRLIWPALTVCLACLVLVLGICLKSEHTERLALVRQMRQPTPAPSPPVESPPAEPAPSEDLPPNSVLAAHRALEHGLDAWQGQTVARVESPHPSLSSPPILRVGRRDLTIDP